MRKWKITEFALFWLCLTRPNPALDSDSRCESNSFIPVPIGSMGIFDQCKTELGMAVRAAGGTRAAATSSKTVTNYIRRKSTDIDCHLEYRLCGVTCVI